MQAAALNLTSNQLGYLLKLLQQMNTFKEHAVSSVWLDPLVSLNKTTRILELHQNQATPANLQVILKCMEAEAQGETLTTYAAPALTQWLEETYAVTCVPGRFLTRRSLLANRLQTHRLSDKLQRK